MSIYDFVLCLQASVDQIVYEYTTYVDPGKEEGIFYRITVSDSMELG